MLCNPEAEDHILRIMGIDPGTTTMGVGVLEVDLRTMKIVSSAARTLNADKLNCSELDEKVHGARYSRIFLLSEILNELFGSIRPGYVACESSFMKRRMPTAYGALMETVYAVRVALRMYDRTIALDLVDPPTAKMAVGASGKADKDAVLAAIMAKGDEFSFSEHYSGKKLINVDEHSSDALAIAYWKWNKIRGL